MLMKYLIGKYLCLKISKEGHFQDFGGVVDIDSGCFYAKKTIFLMYDDALHEIDINNIIHKNNDSNYVIKMFDNFLKLKIVEKKKCT